MGKRGKDMTRRIVICFDGTGNEVGDRESNILKLYKGLRQTESQITHYVPGVGTLAGPRLFEPRLWTKARSLSGLAFGLGLEDDVLDAYRFLCRTWQSRRTKERAERARRDALAATATALGRPRPKCPPIEEEDDRIYIFGFSRGAYAARILAGFLHNFGVVQPDKLHMITGAFRAYRSVTDSDMSAPDSVVFRKLRQFEDVLDPNARVPIRALGLFDTVASLARFRRPLRNLLRLRSPMELGTHANVMRNRSVRIVLHAQAVDERRSMFRALPWVQSPYNGNRFRNDGQLRTQYVEQRWFPGFHSDIGGSQPEYFSGLGKRPLLWMLDRLADFEAEADREDGVAEAGSLDLPGKYRETCLEARDRKLRNRSGEPFACPDPLAPDHPSLSLGWLPLEILPKTTRRREWPGRRGLGWYIPWAEPRLIPGDHVVDESVHEKIRRWKYYRPENVTLQGDMSMRPLSPYLTGKPPKDT